jgi:hypothetical protein
MAVTLISARPEWRMFPPRWPAGPAPARRDQRPVETVAERGGLCPRSATNYSENNACALFAVPCQRTEAPNPMRTRRRTHPDRLHGEVEGQGAPRAPRDDLWTEPITTGSDSSARFRAAEGATSASIELGRGPEPVDVEQVDQVRSPDGFKASSSSARSSRSTTFRPRVVGSQPTTCRRGLRRRRSRAAAASVQRVVEDRAF